MNKMRAKIGFITLAVADLGRSVAFYRDGLGWPTEGIIGREFHDEVTGADGTIAFFPLEAGVLLGLYERANLAKDASLPAGPPSSTEFSLGLPAGSRAEVDELLRRVEAAGGTPTAPAHMRPFGVYCGYFTDPDGHLFEIAWNSREQAPGPGRTSVRRARNGTVRREGLTMDVEFIASVAVIAADPRRSRKLYIDALGLPLEGEGDGYYSSGNIPGSRHFGVWPLAEAAQACFGTPQWPADRVVPQASIEFEVRDAGAVAEAGGELAAAGYELLHPARTEPWGQTVTRLLTGDGLIVGISYAPPLHGEAPA